jgi:hypothetical protein
MKQCVYCAEAIQDQAVVCRYCGRDLEQYGAADPGSSGGSDATTERSRWGLVWVAVLLAAAVPALWNLSQLQGVERSTFLLVYFVLNLLPFVFGIWAGALYRGPHAIVGVLLGVAAGIAEALIEGVLLTQVQVNGQVLVLGPEDLLAWVTTIVLFSAGTFVGSRQAGRREAAVRAGRQMIRVTKAVRTGVAVVGFIMNLTGFVLVVGSAPV